MDYGTFQGILTAVMMLIFFGIIGWAYSKRQKSRFDEAANLVFSDEMKTDESKDSGVEK